MSKKKTLFIATEEKLKQPSPFLSRKKCERLINSLKSEYDFKMLMQNIHHLRLIKQFPAYAEFVEYVGLKK